MFKRQLKTFLHERKLTAAEVARRTGVPKQTLSDWLAGTQPRNIEYVRRVAEELNVTTTQLFFGDTQPKEGVQELTESRERLVALTSMQRYFDFLFGSSSALMYVLDLRTGYPSILSQSWEQALGWPRSDLMKKQWLDLVHPEDRVHIGLVMQKNASARAPVSVCEHRLLQAKGGYVRVFTKLAIDTSAQVMTSVSLLSEVYAGLSHVEKKDFMKSFRSPVASRKISI